MIKLVYTHLITAVTADSKTMVTNPPDIIREVIMTTQDIIKVSGGYNETFMYPVKKERPSILCSGHLVGVV